MSYIFKCLIRFLSNNNKEKMNKIRIQRSKRIDPL